MVLAGETNGTVNLSTISCKRYKKQKVEVVNDTDKGRENLAFVGGCGS